MTGNLRRFWPKGGRHKDTKKHDVSTKKFICVLIAGGKHCPVNHTTKAAKEVCHCSIFKDEF
jgi:hypothetical protein